MILVHLPNSKRKEFVQLMELLHVTQIVRWPRHLCYVR